MLSNNNCGARKRERKEERNEGKVVEGKIPLLAPCCVATDGEMAVRDKHTKTSFHCELVGQSEYIQI